MFIRWILLCSAEPQVLEEFDASNVARSNSAVGYRSCDLVNSSFCHKLAYSLAPPRWPDHKVFDFTKHEANFLDTNGPNYKLAMRLNHIINSALDDVDTSSLQREAVMNVNKIGYLLGYLIVW